MLHTELDVCVLGEQHILALYVAMNYLVRVQMLQALQSVTIVYANTCF